MYVRIKQAVVELKLVSRSPSDASHVVGNKVDDVDRQGRGKCSAMLVLGEMEGEG